MKIMIVEDNFNLANELKTALARYGYEGVVITEFHDVMNQFKKIQPSLVILDINLPIYDGFHFCREIRSVSHVPIICVTSRNSSMDEVMGITLGADDYIRKPYNVDVLLARVNSLVRRHYNSAIISDCIEHKGIELNLANSEVSYENKKVELSKNAVKILHCLLKNKSTLVSREKLMEFLWESDMFVDDNTLTVNINRLRGNLNEIGCEDFIKTKRGQGYIIE